MITTNQSRLLDKAATGIELWRKNVINARRALAVARSGGATNVHLFEQELDIALNGYDRAKDLYERVYASVYSEVRQK